MAKPELVKALPGLKWHTCNAFVVERTDIEDDPDSPTHGEPIYTGLCLAQTLEEAVEWQEEIAEQFDAAGKPDVADAIRNGTILARDDYEANTKRGQKEKEYKEKRKNKNRP